jgi:hypothetical protein
MSTPSASSLDGFVTEVMPVKVDLPERGPIDASTGFRAFRIVTDGNEEERLPRRLKTASELAVVDPEVTSAGFVACGREEPSAVTA